ncbi:MAG: YggS family pyridoxal phosphate-dependent enzyme [Pirellulaceae bacterium]
MTTIVTPEVQKRIADNWLEVRADIDRACRAAGRDASDVTIVGVTKYVDASLTKALVDAGCTDLGENRPQVLWRKAEDLDDVSIRWHLIGSLQRNKAKRTVPILHRLHSLDSLRLAQTVAEITAMQGSVLPCMLEVNISGDADKHGFDPKILEAELFEIQQLAGLRIDGLMCMASLEHPGNEAAIDFQALRKLRDNLAAKSGLPLTELSMGMSGDFEAAIAEGSTIVRIGSRLFEGVR